MSSFAPRLLSARRQQANSGGDRTPLEVKLSKLGIVQPSKAQKEQHGHEAVERERVRFRTLCQQCSVPWLDRLIYEHYVVSKCIDAPPAAPVAVSPLPQEEGPGPAFLPYAPFVPTLRHLAALNDKLERQKSLAEQVMILVSERQAIIHSISHDLCISCRKNRSQRCTTLDDPPPPPLFSSTRSLPPSEPVKCSDASHRRMCNLLRQHDKTTDELVSRILQWREVLLQPTPFLVGGENYLLHIKRDVDTILSQCYLHLVDGVGGVAQSEHVAYFYVSSYISLAQRQEAAQYFLTSSTRVFDPLSMSMSMSVLNTTISSPRQETMMQSKKSVAAVDSEYALQQQYVSRSLLLALEGKYAMSLDHRGDPFLPLPLLGVPQGSDKGGRQTASYLSRRAPRAFCRESSLLWAPVVVSSSGVGTFTEIAAIIRCSSSYREALSVAVDPSLKASTPRAPLSPAASPIDKDRHVAQVLRQWLVSCFQNASRSLIAFMEGSTTLSAPRDEDAHSNDAHSPTERDISGRIGSKDIARAAQVLMRKNTRTILRRYMFQWLHSALRKAERRRLAEDLLRGNLLRHLRARVWSWQQGLSEKSRKRLLATHLAAKSWRSHAKICFLCWRRHRTRFLVSHSMTFGVYQAVYEKLLRRVVEKRLAGPCALRHLLVFTYGFLHKRTPHLRRLARAFSPLNPMAVVHRGPFNLLCCMSEVDDCTSRCVLLAGLADLARERASTQSGSQGGTTHAVNLVVKCLEERALASSSLRTILSVSQGT